jgi:hypothetical protein
VVVLRMWLEVTLASLDVERAAGEESWCRPRYLMR